MVLMSIRVASSDLVFVRRALHEMLGPDLDIYTAVIDNKRDCASLQVVLAAQRVDHAMALIMSVLPEAEFGSIRPSPLTLAH
ncbi:sugar ABC transporter permease [Trinickia acidisoli]|uniref:sugar ABC transporter permease n=1 Tax=Trinickia acidisoli TaxID=2767482 RepID=UPI001F5C5866|nr:sugar ABC transporter permease [Trinickia acidisoli]